MGAWGYGILESDDAMDMESYLLKELGVDYKYDEEEEANKFRIVSALEDHNKLNKVLQYIENLVDTYHEDKGVAYQVLANLILTTGAKVDATKFKMIVEGTKLGLYNDFYKHNQSAEDSWTLGRVKAIQELVELANEYNVNGGQPVHVPFEGLFEKIAKKLNK
jgi:hypothetical protein